MNLTSIILRNLLLVSVILTSLILIGCESDPILAPQSEVAEEGGSYGNTNLPVDATTPAQKALNDQQNTKTVGDRSTIINPKRF